MTVSHSPELIQFYDHHYSYQDQLYSDQISQSNSDQFDQAYSDGSPSDRADKYSSRQDHYDDTESEKDTSTRGDAAENIFLYSQRRTPIYSLHDRQHSGTLLIKSFKITAEK